VRISELTHQNVLEQQLKVMDAAAISLCMESNLPVVVFNLFEEGNIERVIRGENLGTVIRS
jgi:uridylate kinase